MGVVGHVSAARHRLRVTVRRIPRGEREARVRVAAEDGQQHDGARGEAADY